MKLYRATLFLTILSAAPLFHAGLSAQDDDQRWLDQCRKQRNDRERACEIRVETFRAGSGPLRVNAGQNGGVIVESGIGNEIEVRARIQADAEEMSRATSIAQSIRVGHSGNTLSATGPDMGNHENWSVIYIVRVPRSMDLDLHAVNGPLSVRNVRGHIVATTTNGPVSLMDVAGDIRARATNGPITIRLAGTRWEGAGLDAETTNGPVTLTVPDEFDADLEVGTDNGPFNTDIPLNVRLEGRRTTHFTTKLGNGGAPVRAVTVNGPVTIRRR